MAENLAVDLLIEPFRAELVAAKAELGRAATPAARRRCRERYDQALARYSDVVLQRLAYETAAFTSF